MLFSESSTTATDGTEIDNNLVPYYDGHGRVLRSAYLPTVPILEGQSLFLVHCPGLSLLKISFVPIFCDFFVHFFPNKLGNFGYFCQVS